MGSKHYEERIKAYSTFLAKWKSCVGPKPLEYWLELHRMWTLEELPWHIYMGGWEVYRT